MKQLFATNVKVAAVATGLLAGVALAQDVIKIGHATAASGWMSGAGLESQRGAWMAIDELNAKATSIGGRTVRF